MEAQAGEQQKNNSGSGELVVLFCFYYQVAVISSYMPLATSQHLSQQACLQKTWDPISNFHS